MNCPVCSAAALVRETRDLQYSYMNASISITAVTGDFCPACGDAILGASESARVSAAMLAFNEHVNFSSC